MNHCLIVDDSAMIRKVAKRIMEGLSLRATEAEDGEQALIACRDRMPDGVLLDSHMPVMDGCDFIRELRRLPGGDKPKIVFCTTDNDVACIAKAMHAGADEYFMKPFDTGMLTAKLREVGLLPLPPAAQGMVVAAGQPSV